MHIYLAILCVFSGTAASAHTGHIADVAGHDHWVAGAAIGIAILTGIYGALKGKRSETAEPEDSSNADEEVPA